MFRVTLLVIAAALLVACGGSDSDDSGEESPIGTVSADSAVDAVESFDPADEQAIDDLNAVVYGAGDDVVPALAPLLQDTDLNQRWAALYAIGVLADTEEEIAVLQPMLADDEVIFRVMAAGSLVGLGVTDALPVLIEGLSSEEHIPFSDPSRPLSSQALAGLEHYTGETFAEASEWESWWEDVKDTIRWEDGQYVTG